MSDIFEQSFTDSVKIESSRIPDHRADTRFGLELDTLHLVRTPTGAKGREGYRWHLSRWGAMSSSL
jgi:hypothetical protein